MVDSGKSGNVRSKVRDVPRYQVSTHTGEDPRYEIQVRCTGTRYRYAIQVRNTSTLYRYEIQVHDKRYARQVSMYRYTGTRYKYAIQIQVYRYVCTGRTNSTHKNWSQQYTQKLVTTVHTKIGHESTHILATKSTH